MSAYHLCPVGPQAALCNRVWAIIGNANGKLWAGSGDRLVTYDRLSDVFIRVNPTDATAAAMIDSGVRSLAIDSHGSLWIGTQSGLVKWRRDIDEWSSLKNDRNSNQGLSNSYINSLHADADGILWIGTQLGAHRLDIRDESIERINTSTGLPNDDIHVITEDMYGTIWMSTGDGLAAYDKSSGEIRVLGMKDGLSSDEFLLAAGHAGKSGTVYFSGQNGLDYFDPGMIPGSNRKPQIALTEFRINNEIITGNQQDPTAILGSPINRTDSIVLPYSRNNISFEFAALDYADPAQNQYVYRLAGFDDEWIHANSEQRTASYSNLPFGTYTLQIRAANKYGVWNDAGVSLPVTVLTPIWRTWWANLTYVVVAAVLVLTIIRFRTITLTRRAAELEMTVDDRTRQIEEQAEKLEHSLQVKERLFTNVSHEFRTPLTLILGPADKMLRSGIPEAIKSDVQLIKQNGQRLLRLVDQLLDISRLNAEQPIEKTPQTASQIVRAVAESFKSMADSRNIYFETDIDPGCWTMATVEAIEKISMNLLSNAFKYTPRGGNIAVSLKCDEKQLRLIVSDSGIGISEDRHNDVFDRFVRADDSGERHPGAGIGLAIVKEYVDALDGKISLESSSGAGTTIKIRLLRHNVAHAEDPELKEFELSDDISLELESIRSANPVTDVVADTDGTQTVLIVEDSADMRHYLYQLLADEYSCITAEDGDAALQLAYEHIPDIILCDVMLPKRDGYEISHELKSDIRTSHIPIVMQTARGDHDSRMRGLKESVDDYIAKPFDAEEMLLRVRNLLHSRKKLRESFVLSSSRNLQNSSTMNAKDQEFIDRCDALIEAGLGNPKLRIEDLSRALAMSERPLQRKLKALTGHTPAQYVRKFRLEKAAPMLQDGMPVYLVSESVGFSSPAYFTSCFREEFGIAPSEYVKNGSRGSVAE